jgi:RNA polymerase sigma-70 factor (ECF subfamily)
MSRSQIGRRGSERTVPWNEADLVEGVVAGNAAAVSEFLERTHHPVYCMACRLAADPTLRRDWAHDVLLGILDDLKLGRFAYRGPGSFWAWFRKRAYFRLLDEYRRTRRTSTRETAMGSDRDLPDFSELGVDMNPERELERVEVHAALQNCLARIANENQRRALTLVVLQSASYEDVADAMGAPLNTVRAWIRRGRIAVRKCLIDSLDLGDWAQQWMERDASSSRRRGRP